MAVLQPATKRRRWQCGFFMVATFCIMGGGCGTAMAEKAGISVKKKKEQQCEEERTAGRGEVGQWKKH